MATSGISVSVHERFGRQTVSTGSKWEPKMGYSRAVKAGNLIAVTGTVGVNADGTYSKSLAEQTRRSLEIIEAALTALGASFKDVVRTRVFTTRIKSWEQIASVHGEVFGDIRPCTTLVGVAELIDAEALIEIEVDAVVAK
jgi:enamine deaminase RidA (YjgF/YER057c/UK114 family)